jgi:hypothetical protein
MFYNGLGMESIFTDLRAKTMTEEEAFNDPEMKTILVLGGYARELGEGKDFEETTYKTAETIVKIFSIPVVTKRNWFERLPLHLRLLYYFIGGIIIGLLLPYVW